MTGFGCLIEEKVMRKYPYWVKKTGEFGDNCPFWREK
jgi:hypothetical protein